jgi:hypothetical protein
MTDVGPGAEATADGTATGDAHGATDTTPLGQPPLDLQQLALLLAAQQQFQQPPQANHRPTSIFGAAAPPFGSFGAAGDIRVAPDASHGGYGGGGLARGGLGYGAGGGSFTFSFSRVFASPVAPPPAPRTVGNASP